MIKFSIILSLFVSAFLGAFAVFKLSAPKAAYVNIDEIYNNYPLKSELEQKLKKNQQKREKLLDSLDMELESIAIKLNEGKSNKELLSLFQIKRERFAEAENMLNEESESEVEAYKSQIWKQIEQYVKEYGDENGYDYIFSSDQSYYLLYSAEKNNITAEVKEYLDKKYKGF